MLIGDGKWLTPRSSKTICEPGCKFDSLALVWSSKIIPSPYCILGTVDGLLSNKIFHIFWGKDDSKIPANRSKRPL
jgi:hypothetical protein